MKDEGGIRNDELKTCPDGSLFAHRVEVMKGEVGSRGIPSIRPFDIPHREACRKDQPVMTTTNLFTLPRSNQARCLFLSVCPLGNSNWGKGLS